jgi:hypothetical protein
MKASADTIAWLRAYYEAMDALRFEDVAEFLHEDCRCVYPSGHVAAGRDRILRQMRAGLTALDRIKHELKRAWEEDGELIFELEVTYVRRDGETIIRPGTGIFVFEDHKVREQRLFVESRGIWD